MIPLFTLFAIYLFIAISKFYQSGKMVSLFKGSVAYLSFLILLELYRESITILNLNFL